MNLQEAQNLTKSQNESFIKYKRALLKSKAEVTAGSLEEKKYMNVDFFDWL
jgi:hypothetical protein